MAGIQYFDIIGEQNVYRVVSILHMCKLEL